MKAFKKFITSKVAVITLSIAGLGMGTVAPAGAQEFRRDEYPAYRPDYRPAYGPGYRPDYYRGYRPAYYPGYRPGYCPDYRPGFVPAWRHQWVYYPAGYCPGSYCGSAREFIRVWSFTGDGLTAAVSEGVANGFVPVGIAHVEFVPEAGAEVLVQVMGC